MKNLLFSSIILLISNALIANTDIIYSTGFILINKTRVQTIQVELPVIEAIENPFMQWMIEEYDYGLDGGKIITTNDNLYSVIGAQFPDISNKTLDLYIQINKISVDRVKLSFYASFEYDTWMNWEQHPLEFTRFVGIIRKFIHNYLVTLQLQ